jgi:hypothetical protein
LSRGSHRSLSLCSANARYRRPDRPRLRVRDVCRARWFHFAANAAHYAAILIACGAGHRQVWPRWSFRLDRDDARASSEPRDDLTRSRSHGRLAPSSLVHRPGEADAIPSILPIAVEASVASRHLCAAAYLRGSSRQRNRPREQMAFSEQLRPRAAQLAHADATEKKAGRVSSSRHVLGVHGDDSPQVRTEDTEALLSRIQRCSPGRAG